MRDDDEHKKALRAALAKLKSGDRFEKELENQLLAKGIPSETARDVVSYLMERRFVDDRRTIDNAVARRSGKRAVGRERLRAELLRRGAPEDLVEQALSAMPAEEEPSGALALLRARYGSGGARDRTARARAARYLASRGYEFEVVESALEAFFGSVDDVVD
jgi:regulatory protein